MKRNLFNISELDDFTSPKSKSASTAVFENIETQHILFTKNQELSLRIPSIEMDTCIHYSTAGLWSTHELLAHLLSFTGPAHVYLCTWSIKEFPVRMLVGMIDSGLITGMHCLLDNRVKTQTPEVFHLVKLHAVQACQSVCHAKVTVIENENWSISIVGSANYTNNPRIETGIITLTRSSGEFHKKWILDELNKAHPFDDDTRAT